MYLSTAFYGRGVVRHLQARTSDAIVTIGRDTFSRHDLAAVDCYCFVAAKQLNVALQALKVKDTRDLFQRIDPSALAIPGIGDYSMIVLGACFEVKGVGTIDDWVQRYLQRHERAVTFGTVKTRLQRDTTTARRKEQQRKRRQRANGHRATTIAADRAHGAQQP